MTGLTAPALYAPVIHPYSHLGRAQMLLSQWTKNAAGVTTFYGVKQWQVTLDGVVAFTKDARLLENTGNVPEGIVTPDGYRGYLTPQIQNLDPKELAQVLIDAADDGAEGDYITQAVTTDEIKDTRTSPASKDSLEFN